MWPNGWPGVSEPLPDAKLIVLSLGVGVQSSTLALMEARGDVGPMPDVAMFADTGWETRGIYEYLTWLKTQLPFPVIRVTRDGLNLGEFSIAVSRGDLPRSGSSLPPWFTKDPDGMMPPQCSKEFKTRPITKAIRQMMGIEPGARGPSYPVVEQWLGISRDEMQRMKHHEQKMVRNRWPLIEAVMNRQECLQWRRDRQYPLPAKSSCVFCPMRDAAAWSKMKAEQPEYFERACLVDEAIRPGFDGMEGQAFVHVYRVPLREADLDLTGIEGYLFAEDREGVCGV